MFPVYGAMMVGLAGVALLLPDAPVRRKASKSGELNLLVRQPIWIILTVSVFLVWVAGYASIMFMGVTLEAMGASKGLIGVAVTIGAIVELPVMVYSSRLLRRFGPVRLLLVGFAIMALRNFLLGWMPAPGWAVAINMLNGLAFPFFWNSSVTFLNKLAPPSMSGTVQGLFNSTLSLAGVLSSLLTGWLFDQLGPNRLFTVMAFFCLAALLIFGVGSRLVPLAVPAASAEPLPVEPAEPA
jgi:PPP family 3-phenylpropionic acid transporter